MAPEVYRRESYGKSIDVFSFAVIVHEMFHGKTSKRAENPEYVADKQAYEDSRPPLSSYVYPRPIKTLLRNCWHKNPEVRPTFEAIILELEEIQVSMLDKKAACHDYQSHEYHVNGYVFFIMVTLLYLYEPAWRLLKPNIAQMKMYDIKLVVMLAKTETLGASYKLHVLGMKVRMQPQTMDSEGPYQLLHCSSKGDKEGVIQELEKGVDANLADYDKRTALHLAACEGCEEIVVLLLEKGADVNSIDRWGRTPLSDARSFGHEKICKILEAQGFHVLQTYKTHISEASFHYMQRTPCYEIDHTEVDMDEATLIGEGAYGEVYLVKWRGTEVAAKTIRSSIASDPRVKNTFLRELGLWQKLRHPNIVQFLGVLKHSERLIFLTEYLRNGSLYDILRKKGRLDPPVAVAYALDIARGMNYLHQHKPHAIIHRDLTPRNVLQDEAGRLKVTDFGLSKIAQEKDAVGYKMTGGTGSYRYMAPEVYRRESYGKSIDVFSFALIVHEMFQGGPSNRAENAEYVADKRAYEDSRPPLSSFVYPEPIKT
uniref:Protein kinase domain-containing protein n=1 Tax=Vitis vinifera TaxID=29760 RepID=F6I615_VITVI